MDGASETETKVALLAKKLREAREQQTATGDILRVIAASPTDIQPVLQVVAESAAKFCDTQDVVIMLIEAGELAIKAHHGPIPLNLSPLPITRDWVTGRALSDRKTVHVHDLLAEGEEFPLGRQFAEKAGHRTIVATPLLSDGQAIGALIMRRSEVRPFSNEQIELVRTFADQAAIAIENVRLFKEVQSRTAELTEALQQQTATAEVLKVISRSTFDLQTVLDTLLASAVRLCRADKGCLERLVDGSFEYLALFGFPAGFQEYSAAHPTETGRGSAVGRAAEERRVIHIEDIEQDSEYTHGAVAAAGGMRTVLAVPLLRETELVGVFAMIRTDVRPFEEKEIELVKTFADQAVIAMQNVRLFDEVQARNKAVTEALERQTATGAILRVIAQSPTDIQPVLDAVAESAARLCDAYDATILLLRDDWLSIGAHHGAIPIDPVGLPLQSDLVTGRAVLERRAVHVHDLTAADDEFSTGKEMARRLGFRTIVAAPLLREDEAIGALMIRRVEARPFGESQIDLLKTFADQAVIAISNVRLFEEVQSRTAELTDALAQQTATSDMLKAITRSAFNLQTVLEALTKSAADVCVADESLIFLREGDEYQPHAAFGAEPEFLDFLRAHPRRRGQKSLVPRVIESAAVEHIPDILEDKDYEFAGVGQFAGHRSMIGVPLLRDGRVDGVFVLSRHQPGPFTGRQIELLETFADQAIIAIENARLFHAVQHRTDELSQSLDDLRNAQDRLVQTEKLASLGQLTAGIAHEIKNPLNFVNNFSSLSVELVDELRQILEAAPLDAKMRTDVDELTVLLKGNLEKVGQHGKRANSIVKNMLMHSRQGSSEHRPTNVNTVVEESLTLAYHGARAERRGFNVTLERDYDPTAGEVDLFPQEITRVLLNLIANGFYATVKRGAEAGDGYNGVVAATTRNLGDHVEIRIRDNGTGIPSEVREKMFNPFFTTKPAGEGTGLGLSLSHDIIVKQHAGTIEVDTQLGEFSEFRIVLPRDAASLGGLGDND